MTIEPKLAEALSVAMEVFVLKIKKDERSFLAFSSMDQEIAASAFGSFAATLCEELAKGN